MNNEMSSETDFRFKELVARMMFNDNYWGYLFSRLKRRQLPNLGAIMGVSSDLNGVISLIYDPEYIETMSDSEITLMLEHEGGHLLNKHISRLFKILADEVNPFNIQQKMNVWNIAADCCVNTQHNMPKKVTAKGEDYKLCFPDVYNLPEGKTAEYYFYDLLKRSKNIGIEGGDGDGECDIGNIMSNKSHSKWGDIKNTSDLNSVARKIDYFMSKISKEAIKNVRNKGNIPGYITDLIGNLLNPPKAPYYDIINKLIRGTRITKSKTAFSRINRKRAYAFFFDDDNGVPLLSPFPGKSNDWSFFVGIVLDTSGSMERDDILEGLSGSKNLLENDKNTKIIIMENDTDVKKEYEVKRINDIQFNVKGRGGTVLAPALQRSRELGTDVTLVFTDGFCENVNSLTRSSIPKKIIWVIGQQGKFDLVDKTGVVVKI